MGHQGEEQHNKDLITECSFILALGLEEGSTGPYHNLLMAPFGVLQ